MPFTYKQLRTTSPDYQGDLWRELDDLYRGGYTMQARIKNYLPALAGEGDGRYADRCKTAAYINYFGQIADYFTAALFSQEITVTQASDAKDKATPGGTADADYYADFAHDADRQGNSFATVMRGAFTTALVKKKALLCIDLPSKDDTVVTRADEEKSGATRAYCYEIPVEQLIDWEYDALGRFAWCILHRDHARRESPGGSRAKVTHEFKVWTMVGGVAVWAVYSTATEAGVTPKDEVELVETTPPSQTSFKQIPIVEMTVPEGLWVGNKIGPLAKEHLQRRSALISAENRSLIALPVAYLGSEIGAMGDALPADVQQNPGRAANMLAQVERAGFLVLGKGDKVTFEEPTGSAYELTDRQLGQLKDEMFRIVERMAASVDNGSGMMRRSGASKKQDRAPEAIVLGAMGARVRDASRKIYDVVAASRDESVVWTAHGLDNFDGTNREEVIAEAVQLDEIAIPSVTFKKIYKTQTALKLVPNIPPETQDQIREEIEAGVEEELAQKKKQADSTLHALMGALGADDESKKSGAKATNDNADRDPDPEIA